VDRTTDDEPVTLLRQSFTVRHLQRVRRLVGWAAQRVGLARDRGQDMVLAVSEAATNAIRHGGGTGELELIQDDSRALIAQISDDGPGMPADAPVSHPSAEQVGGRGRYLMQEACDHVEYRTGPTGTTVRLEMDLDGR
jgi:anti-sigma regulatory factor (Ser/Thr protein kinase)